MSTDLVGFDVNGVLYTVKDEAARVSVKSKLDRPQNIGHEGDVLTLTPNGPTWMSINTATNSELVPGHGLILQAGSLAIDSSIVLTKDAAFSGNYEDLIGRPVNVSTFANDAQYITKNALDNLILSQGGTAYKAGPGINISLDNIISVDTADLAIPSNLTQGEGIIINNDTVSVDFSKVAKITDIPPKLQPSTGITINNSTHQIAIDNTVALKSDIVTYTAGTNIEITKNNVINCTLSDIPGGGIIYKPGTNIEITEDNTINCTLDPSIGGGGVSYTEGAGISIDDNVISVDTTTLQLSYQDLSNKPKVSGVELNGDITLSSINQKDPLYRPSSTVRLAKVAETDSYAIEIDPDAIVTREYLENSSDILPYPNLSEHPQINSIPLVGNKDATALGLATPPRPCTVLAVNVEEHTVTVLLDDTGEQVVLEYL